MHVSLDSALGRQRRLNSVGESVLQIAPDAAAAYSLRSLTGGDPKVVRVRRASDNGERDFTSSDVTSGEMLRWVNAQAIKPLDIQALEADGRTGDFLIAKAAYSLRSLGTRQATVTSHFSFTGAAGDSATYNGELFFVSGSRGGKLEYFTGDGVTTGAGIHYEATAGNYWVLFDYNNGAVLSRSSDSTDDNPWEATWGATGGDRDGDLSNATFSVANGKFVAQVRRSSDDALKSFTADEVTDGTLVNFVNEDVNKLDLQFESGSLIGNVTNKTATGFDFSVNNEGTNGFKNLLSAATTGAGTYVTTLDVSLNSGSLTGCNLYHTSAGQGINTPLTAGANSLSLTPDANTSIFFYILGTAVADVSITNITLTQTASNGFVKTWYDQSVTNQAGDTATGNHATQATAASQPKIVSAGSLLNELDFDGTDDFLDIGGTGTNPLGIGATDPLSIYTVQIASTNAILGDDSNRHLRFQPTAIQYYLSTNVINETYGSTVSSTEFSLFSTNFGGTGATSLVQIHANGVAASTSNAQQGTSGANTAASPIEFIGARGSGTRSLLFDKSVKEIIIYVSDQTDNRTAIEANIGEVYGIDLPSGVDPGFDQVDGFVETWYDQSGNSNDAVQATASLQPKIVNAGSYLGKITLDGADDFFNTSITPNTTNGFFVILTELHSLYNFNTIFDNDVGANVWEMWSYSTGQVSTRSVEADFRLNSSSTITANTKNLITLDYISSRADLYINGTSVASDTSRDIGASSPTTLNIGAGNSGNTPTDASFYELILYDTDQSANRVALETNINSQYSIF